jgi:hypothetical protein
MNRDIPLLSLCACMAHCGENFTFTVSSELHVTTAEQVLIETYVEGFYSSIG